MSLRTIVTCITGVLIVGGISSLHCDAFAGTLKGKVNVSGSQRNVQKATVNPYAGTLGSIGAKTGESEDSRDPLDVVVYVTGKSTRKPSPNSKVRPKLIQRGQSFYPHVLGVPVGSTVEFPNDDLVFHNVFSYSKTKRFDLGYYGKGKSKQVTFDKPGLIKVFCDIHSNMSAFILVVDSPYVTQPDATGNFVISDIPDGDYEVHIWHPTQGLTTRPVTIEEDIAQISINL